MITPYRWSVSNRFPGKSCVLCPRPSKGVGEHVWPRWFIQEFHGEGPFTTTKAGIPYTKRDGHTPVTATALPGTHVPMCELCNTQLNRSIEEPAKPVVRRLLHGSVSHRWPTISANEAVALARWFIKIGLLSAHPEAMPDNPHVERDADSPRFDHMLSEWLDWMRTDAATPDAYSVYIARHSVTAEQPWEGEMHRILLPQQIIVGQRDLRFATRSIGVRGLEVTIVWHPDWPILHPLLESNKLAALWPDPTAVDFGRLPEVHSREFAFVVEPFSMTMTNTEFDEAAKTPLSVTTDPNEQFFVEADYPTDELGSTSHRVVPRRAAK